MQKALCNQRDMYAAYNRGEYDRVAVDLNRYFPIERDNQWEDGDAIVRRRTYLVKHSKGVARWHTLYRNGQVHGVGVIFNVKPDEPFRTA
ncbi:hypothetical protein CHA_P10082 [Pseudomonas phage CHA_P1]|uniref:DUF7449 domain-containing protein n=1 Tax=Pseudomonas phage CHA_P1 TaxID=1327965 RepID=V5JW52_9CAUD|nr:hypothetical protein X837_gp082 [Pseudomonas phage CHA_P1]AGR89036.1 hypothetical protein CHA_P10082 [Pseudomonas phage CHA_P1]